ncbi:NADH-quinone oxidoreductase subunit N [candidate division LCP-89 bacterium B3_LCP]|uniref:NADH-quinone oxidoreductase subunit N n=1 Tax=candidate division LCP-89 bacterium B3_LCP TaxID=2012998 RepID=A0A532UYC1_UNCL8|nr:MAG: NADH-quinone oxidoreductase subunit N [candidate division LCP-89 bacterium B3_LCP]
MIDLSQLNLTSFIPELTLVIGTLVLIIRDLVRKNRSALGIGWGSMVLLGALIILALNIGARPGTYLFGALIGDGVAVFFKVFFASAVLLAIAMTLFTFKKQGEPYILLLSSVLGMFLLAGSMDIVTLAVAIELVSIPSYILATYHRGDSRSAEAGLKYVLYGAVSTGVMLYGFSLLYGMSGATSIPDIAAYFASADFSSGLFLVAIVLVLAGIGYKIAMVPFHFWCPDVYEGAPTPFTAFFSVAPKAAGFAALFRLMDIFGAPAEFAGMDTRFLFSIAAALTMTFGNLGALHQINLKRLLAYSSIAHAGYILMGFAAGTHDAYQAVLFYLVVYLFMNLGAFLVVDAAGRFLGGETTSHVKGLGKTSPALAVALAVFLFSLVGLPPLAGFIGKFYLFKALIAENMWTLALIGIANTAISLIYYVRVIRDMFIYEPEEDAKSIPMTFGLSLLTLIFVIPTLVLGVYWGPLAQWVEAAIG